jgi:hypothetical protein
VKTLNIVPLVEGNLLLHKANRLFLKKGETRNYRWLLQNSLLKFIGKKSVHNRINWDADGDDNNDDDGDDDNCEYNSFIYF